MRDQAFYAKHQVACRFCDMYTCHRALRAWQRGARASKQEALAEQQRQLAQSKIEAAIAAKRRCLAEPVTGAGAAEPKDNSSVSRGGAKVKTRCAPRSLGPHTLMPVPPSSSSIHSCRAIS